MIFSASVVRWFWPLALLWGSQAHAFPEMIRHGYINCTTCHVSPTGGGVLTEYGRQLSKEVLSTWGVDGEEAFAYRIVKPPEWLNLGGDYRSVYVYRDTPAFRDGRSIFMQADLQAAATYQKWTAYLSLGYQDPKSAVDLGDHLISRDHYLIFRPTDEINVRAGKFMPAFGIRSPDHILITRRTLRIDDENMESYNVEGSYISDTYSVYGTIITGRPDDLSQKRERGASLVASRAFAEKYKAGFSYYTGSFDTERRQVLGPFGMLGFTPHLYLLSEADLQLLPGSSGFAMSNRLAYEVIQGLHVYGQQEFGRLDFGRPKTRVISYAIGTQFFPRPHFELNLSWSKQQNLSAFEDFTDYAYVLFHFYL
jgi:hypothetical protein